MFPYGCLLRVTCLFHIYLQMLLDYSQELQKPRKDFYVALGKKFIRSGIHVQWVRVLFPRRYSDGDVRLTTYRHLLPRLGVSGDKLNAPAFLSVLCSLKFTYLDETFDVLHVEATSNLTPTNQTKFDIFCSIYMYFAPFICILLLSTTY
jgi:hypothetical protein